MKCLLSYSFISVLLFLGACGGLTSKQSKAADEALAELRKLDAAADVGINKIEYAKMLIPAQAATKNAVDVLPDGQLKEGIRTTMEKYVDAKTLWNIMKEDDYFGACTTQPPPEDKPDMQQFKELVCNPVGGELVRKYKIPRRGGHLFKPSTELATKNEGLVIKSEGLSVIWASAKEELDRATKLHGN